jgi:hypothetical protein
VHRERHRAYLKAFIGNDPDRYQAQAPAIKQLGLRTIESRNIQLWYRDALNIDGVKHTLVLRVREELTYPSNWHKYPLSARDVQSHVDFVVGTTDSEKVSCVMVSFCRLFETFYATRVKCPRLMACERLGP